MLLTLLLAVQLNLAPIVEQHDVPALAVVAVDGGGVVLAEGFAGVTHAGGPNVDADSLWHVGSCTKSMTALLAATCVRDGLIDWDTTAGSLLPELGDAPFAEATLRQVLSHTAGISDPPLSIVVMRGLTGPLPEQRGKLARYMSGQAAGAAPGERFEYSNIGYILAGAMIERVTDMPWEQAVTQRVFEPIGVMTAGFGPPPAGHPLGHIDGTPMRPDDPLADNPPVLAPAGTVHMSAADFAKVAAVHLRGPLAAKLELPDEIWDVLHEPQLNGYALGLVVGERPWAGGTIYNHNGSNTMWYAVMWIAPEKNAAVVACTNTMNPAATDAGVVDALRALELIP